VRSEQRYVPSSRKGGVDLGGARSTKRGSCNTPSTVACSPALRRGRPCRVGSALWDRRRGNRWTGQPERGARGGNASLGPIWVTVAITRSRWSAAFPANAATCFCSSTSASARSARFLPARALPLQLGNPLVAGIGQPPGRSALRRRPGQLPAFPRRAPRRQVGGVQPSRRSNAPTPPDVLQPSASRTIFRLYSTLNRRRRPSPHPRSPAQQRPAPCPHRSPIPDCLDSKLPGGHCLIHTGREGQALRNELRALGYVEGQNPRIDCAISSARAIACPVGRRADESEAGRHCCRCHGGHPCCDAGDSTTPIVMAASADAVGSGLVSVSARPGGNVTGVTIMLAEMTTKRLQPIKN